MRFIALMVEVLIIVGGIFFILFASIRYFSIRHRKALLALFGRRDASELNRYSKDDGAAAKLREPSSESPADDSLDNARELASMARRRAEILAKMAGKDAKR